MTCKICNNGQGNQNYEVREMMFGIGETFCYFQCAECKCLQIVEIPSNMTRYYPENYYSFQQKIHANRVVRFALKLRDQYAFSGRGRIGQFIHARYPKPALQSLRFLQLAPTSRILDVGCGAGTLLYSLRELGMQNLLGIDPFNAEDITYENGVRVLKRDIFDIQGTYDLVMFHHAIEHMAQPAETLVKTAALLKKKGYCLLRMPIVSSFAWEYYGVHWVQLDAPRHFYLHSHKSIQILTERVGLKLRHVAYDSTAFQFWGSEQYARNIPLRHRRSYLENPDASIFSKKEIAQFAQQAEEYNRAHRGDSACFYFQKP